MTTIHRSVLAVIEQDMNLSAGSLFINELSKGNPAVFFEKNGVSACVCALGSSYWKECLAKVESTVMFARNSSPKGNRGTHD